MDNVEIMTMERRRVKITALFFMTMCLTASHWLIAQNTEQEIRPDSIEAAQAPDTLRQISVLFIPFKSRMYVSDADKAILSESKMEYSRMVSRFSSSLIQILKRKASKYYKCYDPFDKTNLRDSINYLSTIYDAVGYKARKASGGDFGESITKGQVTVASAEEEKYIESVVSDQKIFEFMNENFNCDFYFFINQFEIKNDLSDYAAVGTNTYVRNIKVHFTVFDRKGKNMAGKIVKGNFPSRTNSVEEIIRIAFPGICDQLVMEIPAVNKKTQRIKFPSFNLKKNKSKSKETDHGTN
jgi:hypothetical protein